MPLHLVRHAHAGTRGRWTGPDLERPLSDKGRHQVDALTTALGDVAFSRVLSSVAVRCQQTVAPLARTRGLEVEIDAALTEGADVAATTTLLWELAAADVTAALSSHGDVIPNALEALRRDGVDVDARHGLPKGTVYVLDVEDGAITRARFVDPRP